MPKIPDFSKFDLQSIVNSVKTMINPETGTPNVTEGDPIGTKIVEISTLLQSVSAAHAQSGKDLNKINGLLSELYRDLEAFRKLESELHQKQQAEVHTERTTTVETKGPSATAEDFTKKTTETVEKNIPPKDDHHS